MSGSLARKYSERALLDFRQSPISTTDLCRFPGRDCQVHSGVLRESRESRLEREVGWRGDDQHDIYLDLYSTENIDTY